MSHHGVRFRDEVAASPLPVPLTRSFSLALRLLESVCDSITPLSPKVLNYTKKLKIRFWYFPN